MKELRIFFCTQLINLIVSLIKIIKVCHNRNKKKPTTFHKHKQSTRYVISKLISVTLRNTGIADKVPHNWFSRIAMSTTLDSLLGGDTVTAEV